MALRSAAGCPRGRCGCLCAWRRGSGGGGAEQGTRGGILDEGSRACCGTGIGAVSIATGARSSCGIEPCATIRQAHAAHGMSGR